MIVSVALHRVAAAHRPRAHGCSPCALALVLGGALGNVIDRLRLGHVVDFIHVHWDQHYFPAFNVADSAITVGAALLLLDAWLEAAHERRRTPDANSARQSPRLLRRRRPRHRDRRARAQLFGAPIYVRHEVVHNRHVVDRLRTLGAVFVEELDEVPDGATVIFSAHGVSTAVERGGEAARRSRCSMRPVRW